MQKKAAEKNKKEGEAFLAENKKKEGVKTQTSRCRMGPRPNCNTKSSPKARAPSPRATTPLPSITAARSSTARNSTARPNAGQPAKFPVNRVVRGWTEALEMMKAGSKWEIYLPSTLAYGDTGNPSIEPGSTLIFDVELLGTDAPPPPPPPASRSPATSSACPQPKSSRRAPRSRSSRPKTWRSSPTPPPRSRRRSSRALRPASATRAGPSPPGRSARLCAFARG